MSQNSKLDQAVNYAKEHKLRVAIAVVILLMFTPMSVGLMSFVVGHILTIVVAVAVYLVCEHDKQKAIDRALAKQKDQQVTKATDI